MAHRGMQPSGNAMSKGTPAAQWSRSAMWRVCLLWAQFLYFLRVLPHGNWGPEYTAVSWYSRFNLSEAIEMSHAHFPERR